MILYFFAIIRLYALFSSSIAHTEETKGRIDANFIAFVEGPDAFEEFCAIKGISSKQSKELLAQIYGIHLGIFYSIKQNWNCVHIREELDEGFDQMECERFHKYSEMLYEYLFNINTKQKVEKPFFIDKLRHPSLLEVVEKLMKIWSYYFTSNVSISRDYRDYQQFELKNEGELYYYKENSGENERKNKRAKIAEPVRANFDQILKKMFKKLEEKVKEFMSKRGKKLAQENPWEPSEAKFDVVHFYDAFANFQLEMRKKTVENVAFSEFVEGTMQKGKTAEYIWAHCIMSEEAIEFAMEIFEFRIVLLYLLDKHWHCANANAGNGCVKLRKYLDILYEYFFRVRYEMPAVMPIFNNKTLDDTIVFLCNMSKIYFRTEESAPENELAIGDKRASELELTNENELNYTKSAEILKMTFHESGVQVAIEASHWADMQIKATNFEGLIRGAFDKELEELFGKWTKKVFEVNMYKKDVLNNSFLTRHFLTPTNE